MRSLNGGVSVAVPEEIAGRKSARAGSTGLYLVRQAVSCRKHASTAVEYGCHKGLMAEPSYPAGSHDYPSDAEELERLEAAMDQSPRGALVVALISVGLLMIGWLGIYFLVFLPRGTVG